MMCRTWQILYDVFSQLEIRENRSVPRRDYFEGSFVAILASLTLIH